LLESDSENALAHLDERIVASHIPGRESPDLGAHPLGIAGIVELGAIVEPDAVERVYGTQIDLIREPASAQLPQLFQQKRCCDHRRSGIEHVPFLAEDSRPSTRLVESLQHRNPIAARPESDGCRQASESGTDDDRMGSQVVVRHCPQSCLSSKESDLSQRI